MLYQPLIVRILAVFFDLFYSSVPFTILNKRINFQTDMHSVSFFIHVILKDKLNLPIFICNNIYFFFLKLLIKIKLKKAN